MQHRARLAATLVAVVGLGTVSASPTSASSDSPAATDVVRILFDVGVRGEPMPDVIPNDGDPDVIARKVIKGGEIVVTNGRVGNGRAADLPAFDDATDAPRAMVKVIDTRLGDGDGLSPGVEPFSFGADFELDRLSDGGDRDNGNNLIQRGLAGSSDQYKIQVDRVATDFRPSCVIAQVTDTRTRSAAVTSTVRVNFDRWYRVRCTRSGATLKIIVTPYALDGTPGLPVTTSTPADPAIELTWPTTGNIVPMSIGGKLKPNGAIWTQSDQFNGLVDNAFLAVG